MKKRICTFLLFFLLLLPNHADANEIPELISIKIGQNEESHSLTSKGGFNVVKKGGKSENISYDTIDIIKGTAGDILIRTKSKEIPIREKVDKIYPNSYLSKYKDKEYRGGFYLVSSKQGLSLVNQLKVEDYLKGVLPKEIGPNAEMEALKAQAIISRTFAYSNYNKFIKDGYNLDDTTASQVYGGYTAEVKKTTSAVESTFGQLLFFENELANTIFHATSGGNTESVENVWGGNPTPYLLAQADPYSTNTPSSKWEFVLEKDRINQLYASELGKVVSLEVLERTPSGRIKKIKINGLRESKILTGNNFRLALGASKIKSSNFYFQGANGQSEQIITARGIEEFSGSSEIITSQGSMGSGLEGQKKITSNGVVETGQTNNSEIAFMDKDILIRGRGYGHGVGMSQYGAINMAKDGKSYIEILNFYFPGTKLQTR